MINWEFTLKYNNFKYWKNKFDDTNYVVNLKKVIQQLTLKVLSIKETFKLIECL